MISLEESQLLTQPGFMFAQGVDSTADRGHMLAKVEIEAVTVGGRITPPTDCNRLNLTVRPCCAYLGRRRLSYARDHEPLTKHFELVRCVYNFIRPHGALKFNKVIRTPAMQAGLVTRRLRFRDIFRSTATPAIYAVNNT